jgi:hypothetical protein
MQFVDEMALDSFQFRATVHAHPDDVVPLVDVGRIHASSSEQPGDGSIPGAKLNVIVSPVLDFLLGVKLPVLPFERIRGLVRPSLVREDHHLVPGLVEVGPTEPWHFGSDLFEEIVQSAHRSFLGVCGARQ